MNRSNDATSMTYPEFCIISIGTLSANTLWNEQNETRTGHGTTTLVSVDDEHLIVNPSLPPSALLARLSERTNIRPEQIGSVFLTSFDVEQRRGLSVFSNARWLMYEPEIEAARETLEIRCQEAFADKDHALAKLYEEDLEILSRIEPAPDHVFTNVDLFPLPGVTPGCCGLLLSEARRTVLICGDAIPTCEHLQRGKVLDSGWDVKLAQEAFKEATEIADVLIPGRDNIVLNPLRVVFS